jgi:hypothetical protein
LKRPKLLAPAAVALVLIAVAAALVAGTSSNHGRSRPAAPTAPDPSARLLPVRAPDPDGDAPWGIDLVRTHSGLLCAQVGRVMDGALGQIGIDGALGNDGRIQPYAANEFSDVTVPGTVGDNADCVATKETFSGIIDGLDRNAVDNPQGPTAIPRSDRREIAYGLLGPHALSITYRDGSATITQPVLRGLGAYLVVRTASQARFLGTTGAAPGSDYSDDLDPAGPTGFILAITYRYGATVCRDDGNQPIARCHLANHPLGSQRTPSQAGYRAG